MNRSSSNFTISMISQYRSAIMGLAILWIIFYHAPIIIDQSAITLPLKFLKQTGYMGVDIFFFLSGFGLMNGWIKKPVALNLSSLLIYYRRRIMRIIPTYWIIVLVWTFMKQILGNGIGIKSFIKYLFCASFLLNDGGLFWFIDSIMICYLFYPFLATFISNSNQKRTVLTNLVSGCIVISLVLAVTGNFTHLLIFTTRLPAFLLGIYVVCCATDSGDKSLKVLQLRRQVLLLAVGLFLLFLVLRYVPEELRLAYGICWYPLIILILPLVQFLSLGMRWLDLRFYSRLAVKFLTFMGTYSLELYLTHAAVFEIAKHLSLDKLFSVSFVSLNMLGWILIFVSVVLSILIHHLLLLLFSLFIKLQNKPKLV